MMVRRLIRCKLCDDFTPSIYTELCDRCWELDKRIKADSKIAVKILKEMGLTIPN